jgi:hypothetical protein
METTDPFINPAPPSAVKPRLGAKEGRELLLEKFINLRNLVHLGYKKLAPDGSLTSEPLMLYTDTLKVKRPEVFRIILDHEVRTWLGFTTTAGRRYYRRSYVEFAY